MKRRPKQTVRGPSFLILSQIYEAFPCRKQSDLLSALSILHLPSQPVNYDAWIESTLKKKKSVLCLCTWVCLKCRVCHWEASFFEAVLLMEFMYLVFTRKPGESYSRWLRSLLFYLCYVFRALINSLGCWLETTLVWDFSRQDYHRQTVSRDAWRDTTLVWDFTSLRLLTSGLSQADSRDARRETIL